MSAKQSTKSLELEKSCAELTTYAGVCLTEFMRLIYFSRIDIQKRFPINNIFNRTVLLTWLHMYAQDAVRTLSWSWPKADWNLLNTPCTEIEQSYKHRLSKMQAALWLACSFAKEDIDLNKVEDQLRVEMIVAACPDKPKDMSIITLSKEALSFAGNTDPYFRNADESHALPIPVCNFFSSIWKVRKDIQNTFPNHKQESCAALILWFLNHGGKELDLSAIKIPALDRQYLLTASPVLSTNSDIIIPRVLHQIWHSNQELQSVHNIQTQDGKLGLLSWFNESGISAYGLEWLYTDSVPALLNERTPTSNPDSPLPNWSEPQFGLNVIGNAQGGFGMSQHAIMTTLAAQAADIPCAIVDLHSQTPAEDGEAFKLGCNVARSCAYNINVAAFVPEMLPHEFAAIGIKHLDKSYNIYYGNWEYEQYPDGHVKVIESFDEIWSPSKFTSDALKSATNKPVHHVPLAVKLPEIKSYKRAEFNLPSDAFLFVHTFDFHAGILRKNPIACIQAFRQAFPKTDNSVCLVIKAKSVHDNGKEDYQEWLKLLDLAKSDQRIIIIDKKMDRYKMTGLVNLADAFISLHRAEGFGFAIAEAMLLAKPVIVTNYSGNTDFTLPTTSCLVNYHLNAVPEAMSNRLGTKAHWAEADISHAAQYMRRLVSDGNYRNDIGQNARELISEKYSPTAVGSIIKERLSNISY